MTPKWLIAFAASIAAILIALNLKLLWDQVARRLEARAPPLRAARGRSRKPTR